MEQARNPQGIAEAIRKAQSVAVCSHVNPDGDTLGSAAAMGLALRRMGKQVRLFCQDKVPENLSFLPGVREFCCPEGTEGPFDLLLAVDVSDEGRLGDCRKLLPRCGDVVQIDHHGTNPGYARVNSIDGGAAATCVMILQQLDELGVALDMDLAICLYTGIGTDTGNFAFSCTNREAFEAMCRLTDTGFPMSELNRILFQQRSKAQLLLMGKAIASLRFYEGDKLAVMQLTKADFEACGALPEHADTLVNYALEVRGVRIALLAREQGPNQVKFSLRAKQPDEVASLAKRLGGGGHPQAAGVTMEGSLEGAVARIVQELTLQLRKS